MNEADRWSARPETGNVYLTLLPLRHAAAHFPEELIFPETRDQANYQGTCVVPGKRQGKMSPER